MNWKERMFIRAYELLFKAYGKEEDGTLEEAYWVHPPHCSFGDPHLVRPDEMTAVLQWRFGTWYRLRCLPYQWGLRTSRSVRYRADWELLRP